jgi:hypothetical protein
MRKAVRHGARGIRPAGRLEGAGNAVAMQLRSDAVSAAVDRRSVVVRECRCRGAAENPICKDRALPT